MSRHLGGRHVLRGIPDVKDPIAITSNIAWSPAAQRAGEEGYNEGQARGAANERRWRRDSAYIYGFFAIVSALLAALFGTGIGGVWPGLFGFVACVLAVLAIWTYGSNIGDS
jgi:hypothetical protein